MRPTLMAFIALGLSCNLDKGLTLRNSGPNVSLYELCLRNSSAGGEVQKGFYNVLSVNQDRRRRWWQRFIGAGALRIQAFSGGLISDGAQGGV